ncbi:MAG: translation initiation factor eIF-2B [Halobacteriaceae archaeon]
MIDETAAEIRAMQTHSSSVVAVKAANALRGLFDREYATVEEYLQALDRNSDALRRANPSHASLQTTQRDVVERVEDADPASVEAAIAATEEAIEAVVEQVERRKTDAAARAADQLTDGMTVLTHDYSTTVLEAIRNATDRGVELDVYVTEARPRVLGRKTARELGRLDGVDPTLVVDSAAGLYAGEADLVLVGMTCIVEDTLYNRVGTYPLAAAAADQGVPVAVAGSSAKVVSGGFRFENDFRSWSEVIREPPEGFDVVNPAYDATPVRLLDRVVTEDGVHDPAALS